tara:strand:+ start:792 stop:1307 length:516 start_codon:yes stop_codon:yes gene_type:complete
MGDGALVKIQEVTASTDGSVTLGGSNWDDSYDVYRIVLKHVTMATSNARLKVQFMKGTSAETGSDIDRGHIDMKAGDDFYDDKTQNTTYLQSFELGDSNEALNMVMHLFSFNNSSTESYVTYENVVYGAGMSWGQQGGMIHDTASVSTGIYFSTTTGNIASGLFTIYGLKK